MNVSEVKALFRAYCDEPDETFMSNDNVISYLQRGYAEFRRKITALNPYTFAVDVDITVTGTTYDLGSAASAVILLGPSVPAGGDRMADLVAIRAKNISTPYQGFQYKGTSSVKGLLNCYQTYTLQGTSLIFSEDVNDTLVLTYVPESTVDWSAGTFIDDMSQFHDMIALFAAQQYQIRDAAFNQPLMMQLQRRIQDLDGYTVDRNVDASHYVQRTMTSYEDF
tara:strand:- start:350 stop:1018 length:669 start_codon:yes stop_codon:yes gene_type:complete